MLEAQALTNAPDTEYFPCTGGPSCYSAHMAFLNANYLKLAAGYLFPEIARRVSAFTSDNPEAAKRLIRCGIGDVTEPLPVAAREAMKKAVDELGDRNTFRGYGPEQG